MPANRRTRTLERAATRRPDAVRVGLRAACCALLAVSALVNLSGCALLLDAAAGSEYRAPRSYADRIAGIQHVALLPPDVAVHRVSAGGVREEVDAWTAAARRNIVGAFERYFASHGRAALTEIDEDEAPHSETAADTTPAGSVAAATASSGQATPETAAGGTTGSAAGHDGISRASATGSSFTPIDEIWALYGAVGSSIYWHTYNSRNVFPQKVDHFDYTLGSWVKDVAAPYDADALLLVVAEDNVSTAGRKALLGLEFLLSAPFGQPIPSGAGTAVVSMALVESKTGDILWFNVAGSQGHLDLRDPDDCAELVGKLLAKYPS
jgi:hypothetical protein